MRFHSIIRSLLAGTLLGLFALAITPKIVIHALVAHHTDTHPRLEYGKADQVDKAGYLCATDNLVVEFPFLSHSLLVELGDPPSLVVHPATVLQEPVSSLHPLFGLRGPPSFFQL